MLSKILRKGYGLKDGVCSFVKKIRHLFKQNKEVSKMTKDLNKYRTREQLLEDDKKRFFPMKACLITF